MHETMVDSMPTLVAPPSRMRSMRLSRSARTCAAVVGETWPDWLAEGATTGLPKVFNRSRATGCAGTRSAMLSSPAVASSDTGQPSAFGSTQSRTTASNASIRDGSSRSCLRLRNGTGLNAGASWAQNTCSVATI